MARCPSQRGPPQTHRFSYCVLETRWVNVLGVISRSSFMRYMLTRKRRCSLLVGQRWRLGKSSAGLKAPRTTLAACSRRLRPECRHSAPSSLCLDATPRSLGPGALCFVSLRPSTDCFSRRHVVLLRVRVIQSTSVSRPLGCEYPTPYPAPSPHTPLSALLATPDAYSNVVFPIIIRLPAVPHTPALLLSSVPSLLLLNPPLPPFMFTYFHTPHSQSIHIRRQPREPVIQLVVDRKHLKGEPQLPRRPYTCAMQRSHLVKVHGHADCLLSQSQIRSDSHTVFADHGDDRAAVVLHDGLAKSACFPCARCAIRWGKLTMMGWKEGWERGTPVGRVEAGGRGWEEFCYGRLQSERGACSVDVGTSGCVEDSEVDRGGHQRQRRGGSRHARVRGEGRGTMTWRCSWI